MISYHIARPFIEDCLVILDLYCAKSMFLHIYSIVKFFFLADIGGPMLSMHSIREMCCTSSVAQSISLYKVTSCLLILWIYVFLEWFEAKLSL